MRGLGGRREVCIWIGLWAADLTTTTTTTGLIRLAGVAGSFALLAELAAELGQDVDVFFGQLAVGPNRLLAQTLIYNIHVERQVYGTVQVRSLVVEIELFELGLTAYLILS